MSANRRQRPRVFYIAGAYFYAAGLRFLGEPFPLVGKCLSAGQSARRLYRETRAAYRDAAMID